MSSKKQQMEDPVLTGLIDTLKKELEVDKKFSPVFIVCSMFYFLQYLDFLRQAFGSAFWSFSSLYIVVFFITFYSVFWGVTFDGVKALHVAKYAISCLLFFSFFKLAFLSVAWSMGTMEYRAVFLSLFEHHWNAAYLPWTLFKYAMRWRYFIYFVLHIVYEYWLYCDVIGLIKTHRRIKRLSGLVARYTVPYRV